MSDEDIPLQAMKPLLAAKAPFWATEELDVEVLPHHHRRFRPPVRPVYRPISHTEGAPSTYGADKSVASGPTMYNMVSRGEGVLERQAAYCAILVDSP